MPGVFLANEVEGAELERRFAEVAALSAFLPICTIHLKARLAAAVVRRGWLGIREVLRSRKQA